MKTVKLRWSSGNRDAADFFSGVIIVINARWWPVRVSFEAREMGSFSGCSKVSPDSVCGLNKWLKSVNSAAHFFDRSWCQCTGLRGVNMLQNVSFRAPRKSLVFGTTWGWVNDDRIFISAEWFLEKMTLKSLILQISLIARVSPQTNVDWGAARSRETFAMAS